MSKLIADDLKGMMSRYVGNLKLSDFEVGTLMADGTIMTDQSLPIPLSCVVIPQYMTDWEVEMEIEDNYDKLHTGSCPGGHGDCTVIDHKGKVKMKIYNHIQVGDRLILLRKPGGQQYLVLSRVANSEYKRGSV